MKLSEFRGQGRGAGFSGTLVTTLPGHDPHEAVARETTRRQTVSRSSGINSDQDRPEIRAHVQSGEDHLAVVV